MSTYRFLFLGPIQIERNGQPVTLKSAKALALLAYLAVTGSAQSRDHLTDLLWPDSLPDAARKNLRNTLWSIRKVLDEAVLQTETDRMALADSVWCDVQAFEAAVDQLRSDPNDQSSLETAIELYRAPLLEGLSVIDAPEFELWLSTARERLGQLYLRALEAQIARHRAAGQWEKIVTTARRALAADNLQEPMHRALMEAHARLGARTEALRQYETLQNILAHELGVEPLPESKTLRAAIVEGQLSQSAPGGGTAGLPPLRPARPDRSAVKTTKPFVGRQAELAALDQALQQAGQGQARVVLLTGELGIGKSRLWQQWSSGLAPEITVLGTRCLDTTQSLPFGPLTTLFSQSVCVDQLFQPDSPVSSIWLSELVRLLPEIRHHLPELPAPPVLPPEEEQRRLFEAFVQVLRAIRGRPLLLFIDDLHWADRASLDWLVYMVERLRTEPLLLVGTYRPSEASPQLSRITASWSREGLLQRLPLARLTLSEAEELLVALGSDGERLEQLQTQSAGNPYFLIELSQSEAGDTPPGLAELIQARLARLSEAAQQVLQAAAVLDAGFDFAILRRTSGRGEEETLNALDDLLAAAVLVERNGGYEFAHPLVATVVHNDLSLARRSFLHRRAAEALETIFGSRPETIAGQLATHYANAGRPAQAAHYAELAGQRALELTAPAEAVTFYQEALKLEPTPRRRLGFGQAVMLQGNLDQARRIFGQAAEAFEAQSDPVGAAEAYLALAMSHLPSGQGHDVVKWAEKALARLEPHDDFRAQARAHHLLAAGGMLVGHSLAKAESHLQVVIRLATDNDLPDLAGAARFELGNLLAQRGKLKEALQSFEASINFARASDNLFQLVLGHNNLAYHAMLAGELPRAQTHIETGLALAERHSLFVPRQYLYSTRGEIALASEAFEEAKQWFEQALTEARRNANEALVANIQANLGLVAQQQGDLDEALLLLEAARSATVSLTATHLKIEIDLWLAELYRQRGEQAAAQESLLRAEERLAGSERAGLKAWAGRVRTAISEGR